MTNALYQNAELAMAAYATLSQGPTSDQLQNLRAQGFSEKQAEEFATRYPVVVTQFTDTETSFSATVFADAVGNLTIAFRGTLEAGDIIPTDANIFLYGAGYDQIVAMYNWWVRETTPVGQSTEQYQVNKYVPAQGQTPPPEAIFLYSETVVVNEVAEVTNYYLETATAVDGTGGLLNSIVGDADGLYDVTGHSLGAHLALAFNALFPGTTNLVTGFNTPGFKDTPTNQSFFTALGGQMPEAGNSLNVTNIFADESNIGGSPWNAVAGLHFEDNPTGEIIRISIEDQALSDEPDPPSARNHSQQILTDSLAVYDLLAQLDPSLSTAEYKTILNQIVIGTAGSYERMVDSLEVLFGINSTDLLTGNTNRNALYLAIYGIHDHPDYQAKLGSVTISSLGSEISSALKVHALGLDLPNPADALAYRYALAHLNPFVITGNEALYDQHNLHGELELEHFSEAYLTDRSRLLALKVRLGQADSATETPSAEGHRDYLDLRDSDAPLALRTRRGFADPGPVSRLVFGSERGDGPIDGGAGADRLYGGAGSETLYGAAGADYLEGNADADVLVGGAGADVLDGGTGDDVLYGGARDSLGNPIDDEAVDRLQGGAGNDTYHAGHRDIIADGESLGQTALLDFNGVDARGAYTRLVEGVYRQAATGIQFHA